MIRSKNIAIPTGLPEINSVYHSTVVLMVQSFTTTPTTNGSSQNASKAEILKDRSNFLREPVATELLEDTTHFSHDGYQILKFHGSYQQDDRDNRVKGQEKD